MQIPEGLKHYKNEFYVIVAFLIIQRIVRYLANDFNSEVVDLLSFISLIVLFKTYLIIITTVFMPIATVTFTSKHDPIPFILDEINIVKPNINFLLLIQTQEKFGLFSKVVKILNVDQSRIHFQIYWNDCEMLQIEPNDDYDKKLCIIDGYPCISLAKTDTNRPYKYNFKISSNPKHPELFSTKIETRLFFEDVNRYRCKILKSLMKVESENREVFIKKQIKS